MTVDLDNTVIVATRLCNTIQKVHADCTNPEETYFTLMKKRYARGDIMLSLMSIPAIILLY